MANRCLYNNSLCAFLNEDCLSILGKLHDSYHGNIQDTANDAWKEEIILLQDVLRTWEGEDTQIIFEYDIPRLGKRIDVVLILHGIIFCLEFKAGEKNVLQADVEQVMDYALDLKNFHLFSHDRVIVPILIPTKHTNSSTVFQPSVYDDQIYNPLIANRSSLQNIISRVIEREGVANISDSITNWIISPYTPTPTIIEAARTLYHNHSVEDITRHEADKVSTDRTINYILETIEWSKKNQTKSICFVTGVPGAGKTLVGLDVAIKQTYKDGELNKENGAVYLSGNGPLVAVLTEALARDNVQKCRQRGEKKNKTDARREVSEFIQIIHRYRDNMLAKIKNPVENGIVEIDPEKAIKQEHTGFGEVEHVAIFDEAQRSWTQEHLAQYLKRGGTYGNKLKVPNFPMSEAEFLIWSLDQREDWAVIVCLVGGGQEINTGEAGITEWIKALNNRFKHWNIFISNKLTELEYAEGKVNQMLECNPNVTYSDSLHLSVSMRSFRAEMLSEWVHAILSFNIEKARKLYQEVTARYPILLTRNMDTARKWLRQQARGTQQTGVLVTKVAARYKPLAVNILAQGDDDTIHWFLEDKNDVRSSNYLEDAATEFQVQGLELDYVCVLWDADMRCKDLAWSFYKFNGRTSWTKETNIEKQKYMLNAYRVLLTRARQGIIISIPEGNKNITPEGYPEDCTRTPENYDETYNYLKDVIGLKEI